MLVGGEDHRALTDVPLIDDVKEDVGRVVAVGEVSDLIDDEQVRLEIPREGLAQVTPTAGGGQVINQVRGGREERVEAILQGSVGDRDSEVGLSPSRLFPSKMTEPPSVMKSGLRSEPIVVSFRADWCEKSNSSMVRRKGNAAERTARARRVPRRWATSSANKTWSSCSSQNHQFNGVYKKSCRYGLRVQ
jgi:hypothetical protein